MRKRTDDFRIKHNDYASVNSHTQKEFSSTMLTTKLGAGGLKFCMHLVILSTSKLAGKKLRYQLLIMTAI